MAELKFDMQKNIVDTARTSGAPSFQTRDIDGLVSYSLLDLKDNVVVRYIRPDYELAFPRVFAFTMYADTAMSKDLLVETVNIQFRDVTSHLDGRKLVDAIIVQFRGGKWNRHIPDWCPAVSGRSSLLDINGAVDVSGTCPLDPSYSLTEQEWLDVTRNSAQYQWVGNGVLAELSIKLNQDLRGNTYNINISLDDFAIKQRREKDRILELLKDGDSKGLNSTAKRKLKLEERQRRIELLEKNASVRGDQLVPRN